MMSSWSSSLNSFLFILWSDNLRPKALTLACCWGRRLSSSNSSTKEELFSWKLCTPGGYRMSAVSRKDWEEAPGSA